MKSNKIAGDVCGAKVQEYSSKCGNMQNAESTCVEPVRTHHLPPLKELLDVLKECLQELWNSTTSDPEGELGDAVNDSDNTEED